MLSHKALLSCGSAVAVLCVGSPAVAQIRSFNVPAQPAVTAIPEFARQAGVQIVAPAADLEGVRTPAVVGDLEVRTALARLLTGTRLRVAADTGQLITLRSVAGRTRAAGTGGLTGQVVDPSTGEYLRNAIIHVDTADGARRTTTSGEAGEFRLPDLPEGLARVTVSFTGYPDHTFGVSVAAGETVRLDVALGATGEDAVNLGEVVATSSVREGDARAIMAQRQSMNITNSLSSESFGDISEGNPGEFIKFMPGVDTDSAGDGTVRNVNLRGLPSAYTSITLNGVSLAAADANTGAEESRTFSFEQMSLGAIDSIEISKTISADVDANAPAGTINIRTKRAFDRRGRRIFGEISGTTHSNMWDDAERTGPMDGGYGDRRFLPNGRFEYSDVFFDRRLGVVASASMSNMYVEQEQIMLSRSYAPTAASPDPLAFTAVEAQMAAREIRRRSASLNLDFRATDDLTLSLASMYNESGIWSETVSLTFTTAARTRGVIGDPLFDFTTNQTATANTMTVTNNMTYKDGHGLTLVPSFEFERGSLRLDGNLSWSNSVSGYNPRGIVESANALSPIIGRGNFSMTRAPGDLYGQGWHIQQVSGGDWSDPANLFGPSTLILRTSSGARAEHTFTGAMLNLTYGTKVFAAPVVFKTGLKMQKAEYEYEDRSDSDRYRYVGPLGLADLLEQARSTNQYSFADSGVTISTLGGGDIYMPSTYRLLEMYEANPDHWRPTAATSTSEWYNINVANNRDYSEETNALYAMATAELTERLKVRAGVRWERTATVARELDPLSPEEVRAAGFAVNATTGRATTIEGLEYQYLNRPKVEREGEYDYYFPSASLKYSFSDSIDLQVGYSRTIRRPEVSALSGVWSIDDVNKVVRAPNPGLEPELSDNLSVRLAKYFEPVGLVAINYYQNRVKGLFQTQDLTAEEFGNTDPQYADYIFRTTTTVGGDAIDIRGYEFEFNHSLDYLPSPFDGLTLRGSYMRNEPEVPIVRAADELATLAIAYRKGPARLYFNTVWTDHKYRTTTPSWFDRNWDTNLSGSYEIRQGWEAFFSVRNLLDRSRNVIVPGSLAPGGEVGDHSAIFIHGGRNATIGVRARF